MQVEVVHDVHQSVISPKTGVAGPDTVATVERPRLNLKPRSNAVVQSGESAVKERYAVFSIFAVRVIVVVAVDILNMLT